MSQYKQGRVNVTASSAAVVGVGTAFSSNVSANDMFQVLGDSATYTITTVASNTSISISPVWAGETLSLQQYQITKDFTPNYSIPELSQGDKHKEKLLTLALRQIDGLMAAMQDELDDHEDRITALEEGGGTPEEDDMPRWTEISTSKYTSTPSTTTVILMSDTSDIELGAPVKFVQSSTEYLGQVQAITTDTSIELIGDLLNTGTAMSALYIGNPALITELHFEFPGVYNAASSTDLFEDLLNTNLMWGRSAAKIIRFQAMHQSDDTGSQPTLTLITDTGDPDDAMSGANTPSEMSWADLNSTDKANNTVNFEDWIYLAMDTTSCNGDAEDLSVYITLVSF